MIPAPAPSLDAEEASRGFGRFGLDPRLLRAIEGLGFESPTPIQEVAVPALLEGRDIVGRARTGSGKTAAFGLPLLERVKGGGAIRALVMTPTRELALQVTAALASYARELRPVKLLSIYGGTSYGPQFKGLDRGATVVVGTPGRLLDHLDRGSLDLSRLEVLVLDEADEMLRMGFIDDVERLLAATPETRQVALFSATMPREIRRVAEQHLSSPVDAAVESEALTTSHIAQRFLMVPQRFKLDALLRLLRGGEHRSTLVFARTRAGCQELADALTRRGFSVDALHGDLSQAARERVLSQLRAARLEVVIATDVAARGIDVDHITQVVNFDLPMEAETYTHRIGRTGRAGREGLAVSFVTPQERRRFGFIEKKLGLRVEELEAPTDAAILRTTQARLGASVAELAADEQALGDARRWLDAWRAEQEDAPDAEALLAAAVTLLARHEKISLEEPGEDRPPHWVRKRATRDPRAPRGAHPRGRHEGMRAGGDNNEVELFLPMGKSRGLRIGDLVGALANEAGLPGHAIGKVTLLPHKSFVGLTRADAERVLAALPQVTLRGHEVPVSLARPRRGPSDGPRPGSGHAPPRRGKHGGKAGGKPRFKRGKAPGPKRRSR